MSCTKEEGKFNTLIHCVLFNSSNWSTFVISLGDDMLLIGRIFWKTGLPEQYAVSGQVHFKDSL